MVIRLLVRRFVCAEPGCDGSLFQQVNALRPVLSSSRFPSTNEAKINMPEWHGARDRPVDAPALAPSVRLVM